MSTITQLSPPVGLETPLGPALCMFIWEHGAEMDVQWCCFIEATGEPWWFPNNQVRLQPNLSSGRHRTSPIAPLAGLEKHVRRNATDRRRK